MRKRISNRISIALLSLLLIFAVLGSGSMQVSAAEKYMEGEQADFSIVLDEYGGAMIEENWECYFGGDTITRYRRSYSIPDSDMCDIEIQDVSMDGESMELLDEADSDRPEGCAAVYEDDGTVWIEMYLDAENEYHDFQITYYVTNAVILYDDVSEFHWNLSSENEAFDIKTLTADIEIPYGTEDRGLYFWGHGPEENASFDAIVEDGMVNQFELYMEDVSMDQSVNVRFAMPLELFPEGSRYVGEEALSRILEEEGTSDESDDFNNGGIIADDEYDYDYELPWYEELYYTLSTAVDIFFFIWKILAVALCALPIIILLVFNRLLRRRAERKYLPKMYAANRHKPAQAPQYYRQLPDQMKPALVYKLLSVYPIPGEGKEIKEKGNAFSATILDLIERDLIRVSTNAMAETTYQVVGEGEPVSLTAYEQAVIDLFCEAGALENPMTTKEITTYMRDNYGWCKRTYRAFKTAVDDAFDEMKLAVPFKKAEYSKQRRLRIGLFTGIFVFLGLSHGGGVLLGLAVGLLFGILNIGVFSSIDDELHPDFDLLTQDGENRYALWKAYTNFLQDFTTFEEKDLNDLKIWRKYLVYAVALGCSEKVIENLMIHLPEVYQSFSDDWLLNRYDEIYESAKAIDTEGGYTIRSSSSDGSSSSDDGWGDISDSGGDSDSGSSGSDFD